MFIHTYIYPYVHTYRHNLVWAVQNKITHTFKHTSIHPYINSCIHHTHLQTNIQMYTQAPIDHKSIHIFMYARIYTYIQAQFGMVCALSCSCSALQVNSPPSSPPPPPPTRISSVSIFLMWVSFISWCTSVFELVHSSWRSICVRVPIWGGFSQ